MRRKMMTNNFHLSFVFDTIYTTSKRRQQWFGFFRQAMTRTLPWRM